MVKDLNKHFTKEEVEMASKHTRRYPTSLAICTYELKQACDNLHTTTRMAEVKKIDNAKCWRRCIVTLLVS